MNELYGPPPPLGTNVLNALEARCMHICIGGHVVRVWRVCVCGTVLSGSTLALD